MSMLSKAALIALAFLLPATPLVARAEEPAENDMEEYRRKIEKAGLPEYVQKRAGEELERLEMMPPFSAESTVSRSYLDWLIALPWTRVKDENKDIKSIINETSHEADLTILGFRSEILKKKGTNIFEGYDNLSNVLFVNSISEKEITKL